MGFPSPRSILLHRKQTHPSNSTRCQLVSAKHLRQMQCDVRVTKLETFQPLRKKQRNWFDCPNAVDIDFKSSSFPFQHCDASLTTKTRQNGNLTNVYTVYVRYVHATWFVATALSIGHVYTNEYAVPNERTNVQANTFDNASNQPTKRTILAGSAASTIHSCGCSCCIFFFFFSFLLSFVPFQTWFERLII